MNLGFYSPFHPIPGISSAQYDLSWEQHFTGTDMSFKLTPFYTWVNQLAAADVHRRRLRDASPGRRQP